MQLSESLDLSRLLEHYDPGVSSLLRSLLHSMTLVTSAQSTTTYGYEGEKLLQEFEVYEAIGPITFRYPGFSLFLCYDLSQSQLPVSGSARVKAGFGWVSIYCCGNNFESLQHYWHIHMCLGIREPCIPCPPPLLFLFRGKAYKTELECPYQMTGLVWAAVAVLIITRGL